MENDTRNQIVLNNVEYVPLTDSELTDLKQFEDKMNADKNNKLYLLAFRKDN
jgi:hypothetical protein